MCGPDSQMRRACMHRRFTTTDQSVLLPLHRMSSLILGVPMKR